MEVRLVQLARGFERLEFVEADDFGQAPDVVDVQLPQAAAASQVDVLGRPSADHEAFEVR